MWDVLTARGRLRAIAITSVLLVRVSASAAEPREMILEVTRDQPLDGLVTGTLSVDGDPIGRTYENHERRVPAGVYPGIMRYVLGKGLFSGHGHAQGPLGMMGQRGDFLLEVQVPGRTDILFHGGLRPDESLGCIMLGEVKAYCEDTAGREVPCKIGKGKRRRNNPDARRKVKYLADASPLRSLRRRFYGQEFPTATPAVTVTVIITDPPGRDHAPTSTTGSACDATLPPCAAGERCFQPNLGIDGTCVNRCASVQPGTFKGLMEMRCEPSRRLMWCGMPTWAPEGCAPVVGRDGYFCC